ncbi:hypothetical protein RFI_35077, partial [Reticulomyxa filosa]
KVFHFFYYFIFCEEEKIQFIVYNWGLINSTKSFSNIKLINQRTSTSGALCEIFINFTIFVKMVKHVDCFVKGLAVEIVRNGSIYRKVTKKFKVSNECVMKLFLNFKKDCKILKKQLTGCPQKIPLILHRIIVIYMITDKFYIKICYKINRKNKFCYLFAFNNYKYVKAN